MDMCAEAQVLFVFYLTSGNSCAVTYRLTGKEKPQWRARLMSSDHQGLSCKLMWEHIRAVT